MSTKRQSASGYQFEASKNYDVSDRIFKQRCADYFRVGKDTKAVMKRDRETERSTTSSKIKDAKQDEPCFETGSEEVSVKKPDCPVKSVAKKKEFATSCPPPLEMEALQKLSGMNTIVMAVDATPTRVGGLLRLPGGERTIYYYSVNWSSYFEIEIATQFEMLNTALALNLFDPYIQAYRDRYENFVVKTDSNFFEVVKGFNDASEFNLLIEVKHKVNSLQGKFQHSAVAQNDPDIQNADYLSRAEIPFGLKFDYELVESFYTENTPVPVEKYTLIDLSAIASTHTLKSMLDSVPNHYLKKRD